MSIFARRMAEVIGLAAIGDGTMAMLKPRRHAALWRGGPSWWDETIRYFEERPALMRAAGVAGIAFGIWLAARMDEAGADAD